MKLQLNKVERGESTALKRVVFHLPNFPDYVGCPIRSDQADRGWAGRLALDVDGWRMHLDSVADLGGAGGLRERLAATTGHAITHVGVVERADGMAFAAGEITDLLNAAGCFLSFARGAWSRPILIAGFSADNDRIWERWETPWFHSHRSVQSWMPKTDPLRLWEAWNGFVRLWNDCDWRRPLSTAVQWYLETNTQISLETALVLCQIGLELLAWQVIVGRGIVSEQGFDRLDGSDRLRLLLVQCGIPITIPASLAHLEARSHPGRNWEGWVDGPHALTQIRNWLVHPKPKNLSRSLDEDVRVQWNARCLGLWYLELILLQLMGYVGPYQSRLRAGWVGEHDQVPWAPATSRPNL